MPRDRPRHAHSAAVPTDRVAHRVLLVHSPHRYSTRRATPRRSAAYRSPDNNWGVIGGCATCLPPWRAGPCHVDARLLQLPGLVHCEARGARGVEFIFVSREAMRVDVVERICGRVQRGSQRRRIAILERRSDGARIPLLTAHSSLAPYNIFKSILTTPQTAWPVPRGPWPDESLVWPVPNGTLATHSNTPAAERVMSK